VQCSRSSSMSRCIDVSSSLFLAAVSARLDRSDLESARPAGLADLSTHHRLESFVFLRHDQALPRLPRLRNFFIEAVKALSRPPRAQKLREVELSSFRCFLFLKLWGEPRRISRNYWGSLARAP
jgi:hypothetical protein